MEQKTLAIEERSDLKKGPSRRLRNSGKIPAIIYGHSGNTPITVDAHEFSRKFRQISENTIINVTIGKKTYDVLVKDFQENIITGKIIHIDFYEIERGKILRTNIPVKLNGAPVGVREGGILEHLMHSIEVECLPKDIPETVEIDVSDLDIGSSIHLSDVPQPENVKFLGFPEQVVALVASPKALVIEEEEEGEEEEGLEGEEGEEGEEGAEEGESAETEE